MRDLLISFSNKKWSQKLLPMNDVEHAKTMTMISFYIEGSKRTIFLEEASRLVEESSRNILLFLHKSKSKDLHQGNTLVI